MRRLSRRKKKFIVALSGGVDSAVTAAILKKRGFKVTGVFLNLGNWGSEARKKAQKIAKKMKIPLKIVDARKEFKKRVIDYFIAAYRKGLTPNPCVVCNKEMKFRLLFDLIRREKADAVATGHYALVKVRPFPSPTFRRGSPQGRTLCEAKDKTKDQSYFLFRLTQKDLAKIIFPLGEYKKSEVKEIAKKMKLPVAENESQDICFVADDDIRGFLSENIKLKSGNIIDESGKILGKHKGLPLYTLGQRKGIEIGPPASCQEREAFRAGGTGPYWVIGKNLRNNELIVTNNLKKLLTKKFFVSGANWISGQPKFPLRAKVQTRYRAEKFSAMIKPEKPGNLVIETKKPLRAVTTGQSAVFYKDGEVLGGGIII